MTTSDTLYTDSNFSCPEGCEKMQTVMAEERLVTGFNV